MHFVHGRLAPVGGIVGAAFHGAAKENAEELVQVSKEHARLVSLLDKVMSKA